jgi:hypothetical protein
MEIKFPWTALGLKNPMEDTEFGFDLVLHDNDGDRKGGNIAWHGASSLSFKRTSIYGKMFLSTTATTGSPDKAPASRSLENIKIDGEIDLEWERVSWNKFPYPIIKNSNRDLDGAFKALWDGANLYLLVIVYDDHKNLPFSIDIMRDYGWIQEATSGKVVWKMGTGNSTIDSNCNITRTADTTIFLKKGTYIMNFVSDNGHSPEGWYCPEGYSGFYGIRLSY